MICRARSLQALAVAAVLSLAAPALGADGPDPADFSDPRGAWEFELSNGIRVRLGATTVERRLDRFFVALDQVLSSQAEHVDYIDMRYTNGFAIGWKDRNPVRAQTEGGIRPHV